MEFFEHRDAAAALAAMNGRKILGKVKELTNIIMSFLLKSDENIWHFSIILYQLVPVFLMLVRNGKDIVASIISKAYLTLCVFPTLSLFMIAGLTSFLTMAQCS